MPRDCQSNKRGRWRRWVGVGGLAVVGWLGCDGLVGRGATTAAKELHAFTDAKGNITKAQVLSIVGDSVNLKRADGNAWTEPMAYFGAADQAYILESQIQQRLAQGRPVFAISAIPTSAGEVTANIEGGVSVRWKAAYKINLKNETVMKLAGLRVRCVVFKTPLVPDIAGSYNLAIELHAQTLPVEEIGESATRSVTTEQLDMRAFQARGAYFPTAPNAHAETDQLTAIWLRVYDGSDFMIQEWCSSPEIFKQGKWEDEWARGGGEGTARRRGR